MSSPTSLRSLLRMVRAGKADDLLAALAGGMDPDLGKADGTSACSVAASHGRAECLRILIEAGADIERSSMDGYAPLSLAAENGHGECLRLLIQAGAALNGSQGYGYTAAMLAARQGHLDCLLALIDADADMGPGPGSSKDDPLGVDPLWLAAANDNADCVRALAAAGADLDRRDHESTTATMVAAAQGRSACVAALLESGADPHALDRDGWSALCVAASNGHPECLRLLIDDGSDLDIRVCVDDGSRSGRTPAMLTVGNGNDWQNRDEPPRDRSLACLAALIEAGTDLDAVDSLRFTAMARAAEKSREDAVKLLLASGAKPDEPTFDGRPPAMLAAMDNESAACRSLLIQAGADMHAKDNGGKAVMDIATEFEAKDCVAVAQSALQREELMAMRMPGRAPGTRGGSL